MPKQLHQSSVLKVKNIYIKPHLKPNKTYNKPRFETANLGEYVKKCFSESIAQNVTILGSIWLSQNSPNGKIVLNLVTLDKIKKLRLTIDKKKQTS
jgi:hypothetical protein